jgi:hypothetical protein
MISIRCCCVSIVLVFMCAQASAKGGGMHSEDRYNPQHIDSLPPEIRKSILHKCNDPKALHPFARYSDSFKRIVLHFEHFICDGDGSFCTPSGCLHQVWVSAGTATATISVIGCQPAVGNHTIEGCGMPKNIRDQNEAPIPPADLN